MSRRQVVTVAMCLTLAALGSGPAKASTIFLQFSSGAANGNVAGVPFGDALWSMEFAVNNATPDSSGAPWLGPFLGAIHAGHDQDRQHGLPTDRRVSERKSFPR